MHKTDLERQFKIKNQSSIDLFQTNIAWLAWYDYCLINLSGRFNKFIADNQFNKRIILLNKDKIRLFANAKSDEIFRKTIRLNVLSLWSCKEAVLYITEAIFYDNCHFFGCQATKNILLSKTYN